MTAVDVGAHTAARRLLGELAASGVRLHVEDGALHYDAPRAVLTGELLDRMRAQRTGLLALLGAAGVERVVERVGPCSLGQARHYRYTVATDAPAALTIAVRFALHGPLDRPALDAAVTALVARHPALRTRYREDGTELLQEILVAEPVPVPAVAVAEADLDAAVAADAAVLFDLTGAPAFRATLFEVGRDRAELLLALHHGVGDGWSVTRIIRDLGELYRAEVEGTPPRLPAVGGDLVDYAETEAATLADPATRAALRAWAERVRPPAPPLMPADRPRTARRTGAGAHHVVPLDAAFVARVAAAAAASGTTLYSWLLAVFARLQCELAGSDAAAVCCPVANRADPRFVDTVGLLTQSSWLVVPLRGAEAFEDALAATTRAVWDLLAVEHVPVAILERELGPLFDPPAGKVLFGLFNDVVPELHLLGLRPAGAVDVPIAGARADQSWLLGATPDGGLELVVEYATDLFAAATVRAWTERYLAELGRTLG